jgi:acyl transferase domain-containing protein
MADVFERYPGQHLPQVSTYSTVTGEDFDGPFTAEYFWDNVREHVRFTDVVSAVLENYPSATFLELSSHPVLSASILAIGAELNSVMCPMSRHSKDGKTNELSAFYSTLGKLAMSGHNSINFNALNGCLGLADSSVRLPPYPFRRKHCPWHADTPQFHRLLQPTNGPLNHPRLRVNSETHPIFADHVVKGQIIMPATGFIEMAG